LRTSNRKSVCERKRCCDTCGWLVTHEKHECYKTFCDICKENKEIGHLCYMKPLKEALPPAGDKVLYVFYDFERSKIPSMRTTVSYTYLISSAFSSFVLDARTRKTHVID